MNLTVLLLLAFAAYRLTRLIVIDGLFDEARDWFFGKLESRNLFLDKISYLLQCTWCTGLYVSGGIYLLWTREWLGWESAITIFAIAGGQGMIHALEPSDN